MADKQKTDKNSLRQSADGGQKTDNKATDAPAKQEPVVQEEKPVEANQEVPIPPQRDPASGGTVGTTPTGEQTAVVKGGWFVVHTYSGQENKAANALNQRIDAMNLGHKIYEVVVPTRNIVVVRHGKKEETKEKIFPGYILVRMELDDESWLAVRTTPGVTAFVGVGNKPTSISDKEVQAILRFSQLEAPKFKTRFSKGEAVKIIDGPFADFLGTIDVIDESKGKVKVLVSIFGRETPVELDFLQIAKL